MYVCIYIIYRERYRERDTYIYIYNNNNNTNNDNDNDNSDNDNDDNNKHNDNNEHIDNIDNIDSDNDNDHARRVIRQPMRVVLAVSWRMSGELLALEVGTSLLWLIPRIYTFCMKNIRLGINIRPNMPVTGHSLLVCARRAEGYSLVEFKMSHSNISAVFANLSVIRQQQ